MITLTAAPPHRRAASDATRIRFWFILNKSDYENTSVLNALPPGACLASSAGCPRLSTMSMPCRRATYHWRGERYCQEDAGCLHVTRGMIASSLMFSFWIMNGDCYFGMHHLAMRTELTEERTRRAMSYIPEMAMSVSLPLH